MKGDEMFNFTSTQISISYDLDTFPYKIPVTIIETIMAMLILLGNGLVMAAYISDRKLRTVTNFFLVNLVVADLTVGIMLPISCSIYFIADSSCKPWMCILQFALIAVPLGSSTLCLLLITVERYLSVVRPFHHQHIFTKTKRYILVAISWLLAIFIMGVVPFIFLRMDTRQITRKRDCDMMTVIPSQYWSCVVLPFAYIIFGSVIGVYMKILHVARSQIKSIQLLVLQVSVKDRKNIQNVKLARTGFILLGVFIMCWLPITIVLTITVAGDLINNQFLTVARVIATILTPASSMLNPIIYAARIRRFKIQMKKLLRLTISNSDKYDTYEIRQSFRVKRTAPTTLATDKTSDHAPSDDSGYQDGTDNYEQYRQNRSLSRISESPETTSQSGSSHQLEVTHSDTRRISINNQSISLQTDNSHEHVETKSTQVHRKAQPPQFLDIPSNINESSYVSRHSYTEEHRCRTTVYDNLPSPFIRVKTPNHPNSRDITAANRNSTTAICAEPIVVDCDSKSEYFRLVVKRTVRDCSDSESDEDCGKEVNASVHPPSGYFKANKKAGKVKPPYSDADDGNKINGDDKSLNLPCATPDGIPKLFIAHSTKTSTLERAPRGSSSGGHQRSPSAVSNCSVGMVLANDDIQFEITNTHRSSKRMSKLVQLGQASLQRRPRRLNKKMMDDADEKGGYSSDDTVGGNDKVQQPSNIVKDIWDGTVRRLRTGRSKLLKQDRGDRVHSPSHRLKRQLSQSLSDVSQTQPTRKPVVHQRSRSALAENETYVISDQMTASGHSNGSASVFAAQGEHEKASVQLQIEVNKKEVSEGRSTTSNHTTCISKNSSPGVSRVRQVSKSRHRRIRMASWSHAVDEDSADETHGHLTNLSQYGHTPSASHTSFDVKQLPGAVHIRSASNPNTPLDMPRGYAETRAECNDKDATTVQWKSNRFHAVFDSTNDVMLPVKLRLPGGVEQDLLLTKQDIYGNQEKTKKQRQRPTGDVTVKRKRSMSQPNIYARHFVK